METSVKNDDITLAAVRPMSRNWEVFPAFLDMVDCQRNHMKCCASGRVNSEMTGLLNQRSTLVGLCKDT